MYDSLDAYQNEYRWRNRFGFDIGNTVYSIDDLATLPARDTWIVSATVWIFWWLPLFPGSVDSIHGWRLWTPLSPMETAFH
jgi:hypothetical protein